MKIDSSIFNELLEKSEVLSRCVLDCQEEGIKILDMDPTTVVGAEIFLPKSKIIDYKPGDKIGVSDIKDFIGKISRFSGNLNITVNENKFLKIVSGNKCLEMILPDISLLSSGNDLDIEKFSHDLITTMPVELIHEIVKDCETIKSDSVFITFDNMSKILRLSTKTQTDTFEIEYYVPSLVNTDKISVEISSRLLGDVAKYLSGNVIVCLKTNYPVVIKQASDISVKYAISPRVEGG